LIQKANTAANKNIVTPPPPTTALICVFYITLFNENPIISIKDITNI
jgi:hypothetical protein